MKKTVENSAYEDQVHFYGRIWMVGALIVMLLVPVSMCIYFGAWPDTLAVLKGLLGVGDISKNWKIAVEPRMGKIVLFLI